MKFFKKRLILFFIFFPFVLLAGNQKNEFLENLPLNLTEDLFIHGDLPEDLLNHFGLDQDDIDVESDDESDDEDFEAFSLYTDVPLKQLIDKEFVTQLMNVSQKMSVNCFKLLKLNLVFSYLYHMNFFKNEIIDQENDSVSNILLYTTLFSVASGLGTWSFSKIIKKFI